MPLTPRSPRAPGGLVALVASIYLGVALAWVHPRCAHAPRWGCANLGDGGSRHRRASVVASPGWMCPARSGWLHHKGSAGAYMASPVFAPDVVAGLISSDGDEWLCPACPGWCAPSLCRWVANAGDNSDDGVFTPIHLWPVTILAVPLWPAAPFVSPGDWDKPHDALVFQLGPTHCWACLGTLGLQLMVASPASASR